MRTGLAGETIIKAKRRGEEVHVEAEEEPVEEPVDLMEALRASIEASSAKRGGRSRQGSKARLAGKHVGPGRELA